MKIQMLALVLVSLCALSFAYYNASNITVNLTSPLNATNVSSPVNFTWYNATTDDYTFNITYQLCINSSSNISETCYIGINRTWHNLSFSDGSVVLWAVRAFNGTDGSNYSSTWQLVVNGTAIFPASFTILDPWQVAYDYAYDGRFVFGPLIVAGASVLLFSSWSAGLLGMGGGLLAIALAWRTGDTLADVAIGGLAVSCMGLGYVMKLLGKD